MREHSELTLRKQSDFGRVYKKGSSRGSKYVVILYKENGLGYTRTAFVASKKVGNAVTRNRARRLMKEAYRSMQSDIVKGFDIVFVARNTIEGCTEQEVGKVMRTALRGCELIRQHQ